MTIFGKAAAHVCRRTRPGCRCPSERGAELVSRCASPLRMTLEHAELVRTGRLPSELLDVAAAGPIDRLVRARRGSASNS